MHKRNLYTYTGSNRKAELSKRGSAKLAPEQTGSLQAPQKTQIGEFSKRTT